MQCGVAKLLARDFFFVASLLIPLRSPRIQIPTIEVDPLTVAVEFVKQCAYIPERFSFKVQKSHDDVRDLHAGVVDVVLHGNLLPCRTQQTHECVAKNGVAQMPDMRGLVGIDAGVLYESVQADTGRSRTLA